MFRLIQKLLFILLITSSVHAQELVQFSMGSGYQFDIYYSLINGITAYPERTNWELAFSTHQSDGNIRINSGNGVSLFEVSDDFNDWNSITSLPSNAVQLRNSNLQWNLGAFLINSTNDLDYGWGTYDEFSQTIDGNKIYVINYGGESKKIRINSFSEGVFNFTIANLDGSGEENIYINSTEYNTKNFVYYSLVNMELIDREPDSDNWDFVFTKYEADLNKSSNKSELFYIVTGVFSNGNNILEYNGFLDSNPSLDMILENGGNHINTIGWDWKEYTDGYSIVANRSYFIFNHQQTNIYKIVFQSFSGGVSGNCSFFIEELPYNLSSKSESNHFFNINLYPNPSNGFCAISTELKTCRLLLLDLNGEVLFSTIFQEYLNLDLSNFSQGLYFVKLESDNESITKKLIIQK